MALSTPIAAVFENGLLKPLEPLKLKDLQRVKIFVIEDEAPADPERVRQMHEMADTWLRNQRPGAVREPEPLMPQEKARLDAEFEQLLAEMQQYSTQDSENEIAALVSEAVAAVRRVR